jgi:hypothetical protein
VADVEAGVVEPDDAGLGNGNAEQVACEAQPLGAVAPKVCSRSPRGQAAGAVLHCWRAIMLTAMKHTPAVA